MTHENDSLSAILESLRRGDPQALATGFAFCQDRLRRMVELRLDARLRGRVSTSDIMQEASIVALKRVPRYQAAPEVPLFIWLRSVTLQRLIEVHQRHLGAKARSAAREVSPIGDPGGLDAGSMRMAGLVGSCASLSEAAERGEAISRLREALNRLDPSDREVLALRHYEELSNREVAALLGIETAAASKRYVRALERLKDALACLTECTASS